jgi:hypothetical protein
LSGVQPEDGFLDLLVPQLGAGELPVTYHAILAWTASPDWWVPAKAGEAVGQTTVAWVG